MTSAPFDTLAFSHKLRSSGFTEDQARGLTEAFNQALGEAVATKSDVREVGTGVDLHRQETRAEFAAVRQEMHADFAAVRQEIEGHRQQTEAEFAAVRQEMHAEFAAVRQEMHAEFAAVRQEIEGHRQQTEAEFAAVRQEMQAGFAVLRQEMRMLVAETKAEMVRWMLGLSLAIVGLTVALLRLLETV